MINFNSHAQNMELKGRITDSQNRGISNVSVSLLDENDDVLIYDFTNESGFYSFSLSSLQYKKLKIEISNMGFEKILQIITNFTQPQNFILEEKSMELDEVVVETEKRVKISNDTTSIKVASFGNKTEQTVEDLLKKLPGIEVMPDGSIKAHGKPIDKLLIEGEDMFDKNYKILSKNLDAKVLEAVQILDNFEDNPVFKKLNNSDKVALNLKLKEGLKNVWFGNATVGSGIVSENIWKESLNIGLLRKKIKLFYFGDYNNLGEKATDLVASNIIDKSSFSDDRFEYKAKKLYNIANNDVGLFSKSQGIFNNAFLNSLSFSSKINQQLTLRSTTYAAVDLQNQNSNTLTQYNLETNPISFSESNFYENRNKSASTEIELKYTPNDENYFTNSLILKSDPNKTSNNLLFNTDQINQNLHSENYTFYNHFNHSIRLTEKTVLNNYFYMGFDRINENAAISSPFLNEFLKLTNSTLINQKADNHLFYLGLKSKLLFKFRNIDFSNAIQVEKSNEQYNTTFTANGTQIDTYQNDANLKLINIFQDNTMRYNFSQKIDFTTNINFQNTNFRLNNMATNIFLVNPFLSFNIKKTGFGNFSISYLKNNTLPEINQLTSNFQLTDYRSFLQGTTYKNPLRNETINFNYYFYNDPKRFSINAKLFYINSKSIINTLTNLTDNFIFNSNIQTNGGENYTFNLSYVNYIRKLKTASKIETTNSWIATPININSSEFINSKNYLNSIKYSATTYFEFPVNFDLGFTYNYFQTNFQDIKTNNITRDSFLNINYKISKTILLESNNTAYHINNNIYSFNNVVVGYTPIESKLSYRLIINNFLNENQFTTISLNNFSYYQSTVQIVPRYVLGTIKYRF